MKLPQLSLRDLFWLVALMAVCCGWWVEHRNIVQRASELDELKAKLSRESEQLTQDREKLKKNAAKQARQHYDEVVEFYRALRNAQEELDEQRVKLKLPPVAPVVQKLLGTHQESDDGDTNTSEYWPNLELSPEAEYLTRDRTDINHP